MKRTLRLKSETLTDLSTDEMRGVQAGDATPLCIPSRVVTCHTQRIDCRVSDYVISLCGCLTGYCSIDVC